MYIFCSLHSLSKLKKIQKTLNNSLNTKRTQTMSEEIMFAQAKQPLRTTKHLIPFHPASQLVSRLSAISATSVAQFYTHIEAARVLDSLRSRVSFSWPSSASDSEFSTGLKTDCVWTADFKISFRSADKPSLSSSSSWNRKQKFRTNTARSLSLLQGLGDAFLKTALHAP